MPELTTSHAVVLASQFNPAVVDRHWLISNGILPEESLAGQSIFLPMMAQVVAAPFDLLVIPQRLQFEPHGDNPGQVVREKLGLIVERLPVPQFRAEV